MATNKPAPVDPAPEARDDQAPAPLVWYRVRETPTCKGLLVAGQVVAPGHKTSKVPPIAAPGLIDAGYIEPVDDASEGE